MTGPIILQPGRTYVQAEGPTIHAQCSRDDRVECKFCGSLTAEIPALDAEEISTVPAADEDGLKLLVTAAYAQCSACNKYEPLKFDPVEGGIGVEHTCEKG